MIRGLALKGVECLGQPLADCTIHYGQYVTCEGTTAVLREGGAL